MESLVIFLVWLALAAIGIIVSVKKKARQQSTPSRGKATVGRKWEEEIERRIRDFQEQLENKSSRSETLEEPVAVEESLECEPAEPVSRQQPSEAKADPAPVATAPAKEKDLDFDPVEMVIYSEVMKPGYEKY